MRLHLTLGVLLCLACGAPGLGDDAGLPSDAGASDAGGMDAGRFDAGMAEQDAGAPDAGKADAGLPDAGRVDSGVTDAGAQDAGGVDAGLSDAGAIDGGGSDAGRADAGAVTFESRFSARPASDGRDYTIENWIVSLIDAAAPGSRIRIALYTFTRAAPADALIRANGRGVDVRLVVDGDAPNLAGSQVGPLQTALGADHVHVCDAPGTACIGSGIMHHKTFLFSALTDGSRNVVLQTSQNLTASQLSMNNNAVLVRGDAPLFNAYEQTFNDLERDVENPNYFWVADGRGPTKIFFFPKASGADPVEGLVNSVRCDATARLRVAMAFFTDGRMSLVQALAARSREGCDVRIIAGDSTAVPFGTKSSNVFTDAGVAVTRYPDRNAGWALHSKYLLIDAPFEGSVVHRNLVFTGSHNWTSQALNSNDETMLGIEDATLLKAYLTDWEAVRAAADKP